MLSPSSRLWDDLYVLYLAAVGWFLLPFYGALLNEVIPSKWDQFNEAFDIVVIVAGLLGAWSGVRGGPLMLTRAAIVHELGSPVSRRRLLLPWLVRQAVAWAFLGGVVATLGLVLSDTDSVGYGTAATTSVGAALAVASAVFVATTCMIATHGDGRRATTVTTAVVVLVAPLVAVLAGVSFTSGIGVLVLGIITLVSGVTAFLALSDAPVEPLWRRASAVESMRSSMQRFDFQRALLDLRNVTEQPPFSTGSRLASPRMPRPLWRHLAAVQHTARWHFSRLAAFGGAIAALFWLADVTQGIVALAIAACAIMVGLELSGAVASTADQLVFVVHYPRGSAPILRSQVITSVVLALVVGLVAVGGGLGAEWRAAVGALVICVIGALGASVQSRLGSPDIAGLAAKYGALNVSKVLWARALFGPLLVLAVTVAVFHQFLRPDPAWGDVPVGPLVAIALAFVIATRPLEKELAE